MLIIYTSIFLIRETRENEILIVINANLFTRNNLVDLIKKRSELEFIISYIYKFKIFKLNSILFYYIY